MTKVLKECLDHQTVLYWTKKTPMIHSDKSRFHIWSENKKVEVVKVLIKHPAINVNVKDKDGLTEIIWHKTCFRANWEMLCWTDFFQNCGSLQYNISWLLMSADTVLKTATILKEMRIVQVFLKWMEFNKQACLNLI